jgi:hypothetical protein
MPNEIRGLLQDAGLDRADGRGCAFVLDGVDAAPTRTRFCAAPRQTGSAYCPRHHARCRLPGGSAAETLQLREIEALATAVGGRQGRVTRQPPPRLLRRLDRVVRTVSYLNSSCIVPDGEVTDGDPSHG